ncbi:unnamed protein product [Acanthosepion pharaonis]|uniref:Uncharacterized protein n=1 Tax=Acanthosepion pharaonis TaxID=158019 RepID=A0A812CM00_ACAPH|nr:unnamed protein product [Sepia pharaonis]
MENRRRSLPQCVAAAALPRVSPFRVYIAPQEGTTDTRDGCMDVMESIRRSSLPTLPAMIQPTVPIRVVMKHGSSTVAIDNKIEQAMDLVKSHLMFAVREEVEVLKEQIKELTEKNNQLEYENTILRTSASPDTLSKLSQPRPQPPPATTS